MTTLDWYGMGALALIVLFFYSVRSVRAYVILCVLIAGGFAATTSGLVDWDRPSEWIVMTTGLLLCAFGLLIVRVMLIRSVSLQILGRIEGGTPNAFGEDLVKRLHDMRVFRLIRTTEGSAALTPFGHLVSSVVTLFYSLFRIQA